MSARLIAALVLTSLGLALPTAPASAAFVSLVSTFSTPTQENFDVLITSTEGDTLLGECATPPCLGVSSPAG